MVTPGPSTKGAQLPGTNVSCVSHHTHVALNPLGLYPPCLHHSSIPQSHLDLYRLSAQSSSLAQMPALPALEDEEPPPHAGRGGRSIPMPLTTHISRYPHLDSSNLRTRTPSPEPWSDSDVPHDEEEDAGLLRYHGRAKPPRRLREGWITVLGFKVRPCPLAVH